MPDYSKLLALIDEIKEADSFGEWAGGNLRDDGARDMPYISYGEIFHHLLDAIESFRGYRSNLEDFGLSWDADVFSYDVSHANEQCILALLQTAIEQERFCEGTVLKALKEGYIFRWLERLAELVKA